MAGTLERYYGTLEGFGHGELANRLSGLTPEVVFFPDQWPERWEHKGPRETYMLTMGTGETADVVIPPQMVWARKDDPLGVVLEAPPNA